jgi:single-strand DNA-binding protein
MSINNATIIGNLTREAEIRYTSGGLAIVRFSIAVNRKTKKGDAWVDEAMFFDVQYLGKGAEGVHKYLVKGKPVAISGFLRQDRWEKEGQKHSKVYIQVNELQLLNSRQDSGQAPKQYEEPEKGREYYQGDAEAGAESFEDDVPF